MKNTTPQNQNTIIPTVEWRDSEGIWHEVPPLEDEHSSLVKIDAHVVAIRLRAITH